MKLLELKFVYDVLKEQLETVRKVVDTCIELGEAGFSVDEENGEQWTADTDRAKAAVTKYRNLKKAMKILLEEDW